MSHKLECIQNEREIGSLWSSNFPDLPNHRGLNFEELLVLVSIGYAASPYLLSRRCCIWTNGWKMFLKFVKNWAPIWKNTWFTVEFITRTMHKPGHYRWVKVRVFPLRVAFGAFVFWSIGNFSFSFLGFEGNCWRFFIWWRTIV